MADVTFTTTSLKRADNNSKVETAYSGEAITVGDSVYVTSAGLVFKTDSNAAATAPVRGFALNTVPGVGQPVMILTEGNLTCDGLTKGTPYFISSTAGKICPFGGTDVAAGMYVSFVGIATSATNLLVSPLLSGITV